MNLENSAKQFSKIIQPHFLHIIRNCVIFEQLVGFLCAFLGNRDGTKMSTIYSKIGCFVTVERVQLRFNYVHIEALMSYGSFIR